MLRSVAAKAVSHATAHALLTSRVTESSASKPNAGYAGNRRQADSDFAEGDVAGACQDE